MMRRRTYTNTREMQVAEAMANGDTILPDGTAVPLSPQGIAARLGLPVRYVHAITARIRKRLGPQAR